MGMARCIIPLVMCFWGISKMGLLTEMVIMCGLMDLTIKAKSPKISQMIQAEFIKIKI
jgi:hypothetical protein